jgi:hypothetical protein
LNSGPYAWRNALYPLSHTPSLFFNRVSLFAWASLASNSIYVSCVAGMTGTYHCAQLLLVEVGSPRLLVPTGLESLSS